MPFELKYLFFLVGVILLPSIKFCTGQFLTAEFSAVKLPSPTSCPTTFYDGNDKIYILGGCNSVTEKQILVYSLSSDTIEMMGTLPEWSNFGSVQGDSSGNIFYLGGGNDHRAVYKFDPAYNMTTVAATLPLHLGYHTSIKFNDTSNTVHILGGVGQNKDVLAFDLQRFNYSILTSVQYNVISGTSVRLGDKTYIFASSGDGVALEFDLNTFLMRRVGPSSLPQFDGYPSSVADENFAYIIGGYDASTGSTGGVIKFDTKSFENTFLSVRNFPVQDLSYYYYAPGSVFVPSLNRIYCFGGGSYNSTTIENETHDEIFYIDLSPLAPSTTTPTPTTTTIQPPPSTIAGQPIGSTLNPDFFLCSNRATGLYPHPTDCSMFIGCLDNEMTFFQCPPPLLFDPILTVCHYPDQVECGISCVDKPDGDYPHPHDCSLYIICRSGVPNVFKCPHPLLFDPIQRYCYFPHLVTCSVSA